MPGMTPPACCRRSPPGRASTSPSSASASSSAPRSRPEPGPTALYRAVAENWRGALQPARACSGSDVRSPRLQEPAPPRRRRSYPCLPWPDGPARPLLLGSARLPDLDRAPARRLGLPAPRTSRSGTSRSRASPRDRAGAPPARRGRPGTNLWSPGSGRDRAGHGAHPGSAASRSPGPARHPPAPRRGARPRGPRLAR